METETYTEGQRIRKWGHMEIPEGATMVRRDSLKSGDVVISSHYGRVVVTTAEPLGGPDGTAYLRFVSGNPDHIRSEAYPSASLIPLVTKATHPALTSRRVIALGTVVDAAQRGAKVRRMMPDESIVEGTARSIGDQWGNFAGPNTDIRDSYLRVTSTRGFDYFWPVADLIEQAMAHTFVLDN